MKHYLFLLLLPLSIVQADFNIRSGIEMHWKYQNLISDLEDYTLMARFDRAFDLENGGQIYFRAELPYIWLWGSKDQEVELDADGIIFFDPHMAHIHTNVNENGIGDLVTKVFCSTAQLGDAAQIGMGSEFIFPTAQKDDLGGGKYAARPIVGFRWHFPTLGNGASVLFFTKYQFSFAGQKDRPSYQIFSMEPIFTIAYGKGWRFTTGPEVQYNCKTAQWFVPVNFTLSRVMDQVVCSLEYQRGLVTNFPVFQDEVELTISYKF